MRAIGIKKKQGSIVEVLKDEILMGRISCGVEMTQNELADSLGVSRMPVREALILLEYQGLVNRLPNNHVKVAEFSEDYFAHIFHYCAKIESELLLKHSSSFTHSMEEDTFHRLLLNCITHSFFRKNMETMIDIYVAFVLKSNAYRKERAEILNRVISACKAGETDKCLLLLTEYFDILTKAMMQIRESS